MFYFGQLLPYNLMLCVILIPNYLLQIPLGIDEMHQLSILYFTVRQSYRTTLLR